MSVSLAVTSRARSSGNGATSGMRRPLEHKDPALERFGLTSSSSHAASPARFAPAWTAPKARLAEVDAVADFDRVPRHGELKQDSAGSRLSASKTQYRR